MPVRIYDIAKKLGIESKVVLAKAKELGISTARVPSSSLDKITAEFLEGHFAPKPAAPPEPVAPAAPEPIVMVTRPEPPPVAPEVAPPAPPAIPVETPPEAPVVEPAGEAPPEPVEVKAPVVEPSPPVPATPPPPPTPRVGDKVGFVQLPTKPAPKAPDKGAAPKPFARQTTPARPGATDFQRRGDTTRFGRPAPGRPPFQRPAGQQGRPAAPAAPPPEEPKFVPPQTGEVITLKPPIIVRDLAEQLKRRP